MKVYIRPFFDGPDRGEGGIRRWVEAQRRYLPEHGIEVVGSEGEADLVACHGGDLVNTSRPLVCHNHGLYATAEQSWSRWEWLMNRNVVELLRRAAVSTVPSQWVRNQVARGLGVDARVIYAGVDPADWEPGEPGGYVLWNKTRVDPVCDPAPVVTLARAVPGVQFVSTFGQPLPNLKLTGKLPFGQARDLIRNAGVYLSTARETFGIGTVEAMAAGVPVLGWRWGGQAEIVRHGETGYLATPGDYAELAYGLALCQEHRADWGEAARADALSRFSWGRAIGECADVYREALGEAGRPVRTSIIVTCYDLERYVPECLDSVKRQTAGDWECLVIDDCSPGNCREIVEGYSREDSRFHYVRTPRNLYLAGARNYGIERATGRYVLPLDADDTLGERAVEVLAGVLDKEPGLSVAYGAMQVIEEGKDSFVSGWPMDFSWHRQMQSRNQLPYASLYRRWVWQRTGGYRERCTTAEDADFWCRVSSFGARPAKVTDYPCLIYRNRPESMSHKLATPDYAAWYPWAKAPQLAPFGSVGEPPVSEIYARVQGRDGAAQPPSWPVRTYAHPRVSVVIPVGPGHERLVVDALDSVLAQTVDAWEVIVVDDAGGLALKGHPWARVLSTPSPKSGPAVARNVGARAARGEYLLFLDADDYLLPTFLERTLAAAREHGGYAYTDWFQVGEDGQSEVKEAPDFDVMDLLFKGLQFTVTALVPRTLFEEVGGFDEACRQWEDWDLFFSLATREVCGSRVPEPLFAYRYWSGQRREDGYAHQADNAKLLREKWADWAADGGKRLMACRSCGKGGGRTAAAPTNGASQAASIGAGDMVLLEYVSQSAGARTYRGPATRQIYTFDATPQDSKKFVWKADAEAWITGGRPEFRLVSAEPAAAAPASAPPAVRQGLVRLG